MADQGASEGIHFGHGAFKETVPPDVNLYGCWNNNSAFQLFKSSGFVDIGDLYTFVSGVICLVNENT